MKAVLASLKPYYYYLVGEGIKSVEVRKNYPKAEDWSRETYFYMSRDEKSFAKIPKEFQEKYRKHFGKVGMRFVCDRIDGICWAANPTMLGWKNTYNKNSCLTDNELYDYTNGDLFYEWHITDLVIYDNPRGLGEFYVWKKCNSCRDTGYESTACCYDEDCRVPAVITRPPKSWCYCEEVEK